MRKTFYLPDNDAERLTWLTNFNSKLVNTYAAILGLTPAQLLYILTGLRMYTYMLACVTAAESFYHSIVSYKDTLNASVVDTVTHPIPTYVPPAGAPTVMTPAGFIGWIMLLVANIKTNDAYTTEMGVDLDIIGTDIVINWLTAQPTKIKVAWSAGMVKGGFYKGQSNGGRVDSRRGTETVFTTLTNVNRAKFIDDRPNLVVGTPETRQYRIWYLRGDVVVGIVSVIVTITVEG